MENTPTEQNDTLTGFDLSSGHLETLTGNTFLVRAGERDVALMWIVDFQVAGGKQPSLHNLQYND
jgi:hypothetical protein